MPTSTTIWRSLNNKVVNIEKYCTLGAESALRVHHSLNKSTQIRFASSRIDHLKRLNKRTLFNLKPVKQSKIWSLDMRQVMNRTTKRSFFMNQNGTRGIQFWDKYFFKHLNKPWKRTTAYSLLPTACLPNATLRNYINIPSISALSSHTFLYIHSHTLLYRKKSNWFSPVFILV